MPEPSAPRPFDAPSSALALRTKISELKNDFHSPIDFGGGVIAKPWHVQRRFRRRLRLMQIPEDLSGKTVLDIGAWDGYFSFEFERRGAKRVLAIDTFAWQTRRGYEAFLLAHEHFNSRVEHQRLDVHDLDPGLVGKFDVVFCAGVLYHLRYPLFALEKIRSVTAGVLLLETSSLIPAFHESTPLVTFFPGDEMADQFATCHGGYATRAWLSGALRAAGFRRHEFIYTPSWRYLKKALALITNRPRCGRLIVRAFPE